MALRGTDLEAYPCTQEWPLVQVLKCPLQAAAPLCSPQLVQPSTAMVCSADTNEPINPLLSGHYGCTAHYVCFYSTLEFHPWQC